MRLVKKQTDKVRNLSTYLSGIIESDEAFTTASYCGG